MAKRVWLKGELDDLPVEELRKIVARHQRIIDSSGGYGFWDWDMRTHHFDWSGEFWQRLGYGEDDATQINDARRLPELIHQDDWESAQGAIVNHLKTGAHINSTFRVRAKDGSYRWSQCVADSVRDENGRAIYLSGINFDITEIKEAEEITRENEERQMRIINASSDGIWEWSPKEETFFFSKRCWEQIGVHVSDHALTEGVDQFLAYRRRVLKEDLDRYDEVRLRHLRGDGPFDVEFRIIGGEGKMYWIRTRGQAEWDDDGEVIRLSGTNLDITELKEAEERVLRAKEGAERANQAKSQFLSSMSHELRTPLNAILGFVQLFDYDTNITESQRENLWEIRKAGQHLLQLINDVLDLAKIESGRLTLSLEPVLPIRVVDECLGLVQSLADSRGIKVDVQNSGLDNLYLHADAVRLKQVLLNLLSNSIKYNRDNGSVTVAFVSNDPNTLTVQVIDTGYGIPDSLRDAVFEPFNRLGAEQSATEGSGVGLVITKQLVEMMDGELRFESRLGEGTCFEVTFKQAKEWTVEHATRTPAHVVPEGEVELKLRGKYRLLYIEDNASNLRLMEQLLQRYEQVELETANEAFRGLFKARTMQPDLIILDINLPGLDGFEALKVLKQDSSTAKKPVIALSANAMPYDIERGLTAGFDAYLTKPVVFAELIGTLNRLLADTQNKALVE